MVVAVVLIGLNVTFLVDFAQNASPVFKMEVRDFVDVLDSEESDDRVMVTMAGGAHLQPSVFGLSTALKRPFLRCWKRAPTSDFFLAPCTQFFFEFWS